MNRSTAPCTPPTNELAELYGDERDLLAALPNLTGDDLPPEVREACNRLLDVTVGLVRHLETMMEAGWTSLDQPTAPRVR